MYKIRNPSTAQEKTVHCNFIMLVNFLPLCDTSEERIETVGSVASSSPADYMNAEERTSAWVSELTSDMSEDEGSDSVGEKYMSSREVGLVPASDLFLVGDTMDGDQMAPDSDSCVSNTADPMTLTCDLAQSQHSDFRHTYSDYRHEDFDPCESNAADSPTMTRDPARPRLCDIPDSACDLGPTSALVPGSDCETVENGTRITRAGQYVKPVRRLIETIQTQRVWGDAFKQIAVWVLAYLVLSLG